MRRSNELHCQGNHGSPSLRVASAEQIRFAEEQTGKAVLVHGRIIAFVVLAFGNLVKT